MNPTGNDNQTNVADPVARTRSRRWWRWLILGSILFIAAMVGSYAYRLRRHAQLIQELEEYYDHVETVAVYSTWVDRKLDELTSDREEYFRRVGVVDRPRRNSTMPAGLISRLTRDSFESLETMELLDPELTLHAASDLGQVDSLSSLEIWFTDDSPPPVSAEVLAGLAESNSLESFLISNASLPPKTFAILSDMSSLRELDLVFCDVSLDDLSALKKLPNLRSLSLWAEDANDDRLREIAQLSQLEHLYLWSPNKTESLAVYAYLKQELPHCGVHVELGMSPDDVQMPWEIVAILID